MENVKRVTQRQRCKQSYNFIKLKRKKKKLQRNIKPHLTLANILQVSSAERRTLMNTNTSRRVYIAQNLPIKQYK